MIRVGGSGIGRAHAGGSCVIFTMAGEWMLIATLKSAGKLRLTSEASSSSNYDSLKLSN